MSGPGTTSSLIPFLTNNGGDYLAVAGIRDARSFDALIDPIRRLMAQRVLAELREETHH